MVVLSFAFIIEVIFRKLTVLGILLRKNVDAFSDEECLLSGITAKVKITSLNTHFCPSESSTKCGSLVSKEKVWIKVCNLHSRSLNGE